MEKKYLSNTMLKNKFKIFENKVLLDFVKKSLALVAFVYLSFFALESILPGIVMDVFNFNFLLFAIVAMMAFVMFFDEKKDEKKEQDISEYKYKIIMAILLLLFVLTLGTVLYKVSLLETGIYLVFCLLLMKPLKNLFE